MAKTKVAATVAASSQEGRQLVGYRYIGNGAYFPGIPLRDLAGRDLVRYARAIDEVTKAGTFSQLYAPIYKDEDEVSNG